MDLILMFNALLKRKWILIIVPIISVAAAFVLTMGAKKLYKSVAQLSTGFTIREEVSLGNDRFNVFEAEAKFNNLLETMKSPRIYGLLSYKLILHDLESKDTPFRTLDETTTEASILEDIDLEAVKKTVTQKLDSLDFLSTFNEEDRKIIELMKAYKYDYESLRKSTSIKRVTGTDYITLYAFTENPELSAYVVNTLCDVFLRYNSISRSEKSVQSVDMFANLVKQKKTELDQKADELRRFKSSNQVLNFEMESSSMITQIAEFERQREEEKREIKGLEIEIQSLDRRLRSQGASGTGGAMSNDEIVKLRKEIRILNNRYIEQGAGNPGLQDSIKTLRKELQVKIAGLTSGSSASLGEDELLDKRDGLKIQLEIAKENLNAIEAQLTALKSNAGGYASKEARMAGLDREVKTAAQEYLNAQEKYNSALDLAMASNSTMKQSLIGQPAVEPEPSKRLVMSALSGASSFVLCAMVIILLVYLDVSIKTPTNFQKITRLRIIGAFNELNLKKNPIPSLFAAVPKKKAPKTFREQLKKLRFEMEKGDKKTFLFTSTKNEEGKSLIIQALAAAIGLSKRKVLIIDTNFPNNSLTKTFKAKPALEEFVNSGNGDFEKAITKTKNPLIDVLGCKSGGYSPSEVLPNERFKKVLAHLRETYDYIFLEGPALNIYSDSKELSEFVEGVVAIFSAKSSLKQIDKESIGFLTTLKKGKFTGSVLNKIELDNMEQ